MSEEQQDPGVGLTLKAGDKFSDPWITPRAGSVTGLREIIDQFQSDPNLLRDISVLADAFHKVYLEVKNGAPVLVQGPTQEAPSASTTSAPPASQPAAQGGQGQEQHFCPKCGSPMPWKEWTRASDQKHFKGFFCPAGKAKGDGHGSKMVWD